jgi:hypothetical protein
MSGTWDLLRNAKRSRNIRSASWGAQQVWSQRTVEIRSNTIELAEVSWLEAKR